jgi:hypothetical protein
LARLFALLTDLVKRSCASLFRKRTEIAFSSSAEQMPQRIRAATPRDFELKVCLFLLTFTICGEVTTYFNDTQNNVKKR